MLKKIAIPVNELDELDAHFGHCKKFAVLECYEGTITNEEAIVPPPHEPGLLPKWLAEQGVTDILAGGIGQKAIALFKHYGINVFAGAPYMSSKQLTEGFLNGALNFRENYCDH
ncbi:MAG: ATPase [Bacteroidetes bacterium]|jgi:predicted Fe-Mo cluster-binding NifX family protein|nr:ATPase [Bacteroidota bacterium]